MSTNQPQEWDDSARAELEIVVKRLGGVYALARLCEVKHPSICQWRHNGLPAARRMFLQAVRPDAFVGTRWEVKTEPQEA